MDFNKITSPPPNSAITVERSNDSVQFSGASKSASQEALREEMIKFKSPPKSVEERLASLPWQLKISANKIEFIQEKLIGVSDDERIFRPQDVQNLSVSPEGYVIAHLAGRGGDEAKVPLTGFLEEPDANWLRDTFTDLLGGSASNQQPVSAFQSRARTGVDQQQMPNDIRMVSSGSSSRLILWHLPSVELGQKIAMTVIFVVFGAAFGGPALYFASRNWDELRELPLPLWAALLGIVMAVVVAIRATRRAAAKRAPGSSAELHVQVKAAGKRALLAALFIIVQLAIVFFAYRNLEKLTKTPLHIWLAALALIAGIGFVSYFVWQILLNLFGRTVFTATDQLLRIQKKLVFPGSSRVIPRHELESFELLELVHVDEGKEHRYWGLDAIVTNKAVRLLPKEIEFDTADWLGRTLAQWFGVSFVKAHEKEAVRSVYYEELG